MRAVLDPSNDFPLATNAIPVTTTIYEPRDALSRVWTWHRNPNEPASPGRRHVAYIDGLGVDRLHLDELDGGRWLATGAATRNARGQVVTTAATGVAYAGDLDAPTLELDPSATLVTQTYDEYGRPTSTWEGPASGVNVGTRQLGLTTYAPLRSTIYDANGLDTASEAYDSRVVTDLDGHGRVVRTSTKTFSESADVSYDYLPTGERVRETRASRFEPKATVRERVFDTLGRVVLQRDPNTTANGRPLIYVYNDAGWLVGTSDSRGCGQNIAYDAVGREVYRDFSPCTNGQAPYTEPAPYGGPTFGDGTETFAVYDAPEPGEGLDESGVTSSLPGRLVASYDRGAHTRYKYDYLGRTTRVGRRIAAPGVPETSLAAR